MPSLADASWTCHEFHTLQYVKISPHVSKTSLGRCQICHWKQLEWVYPKLVWKIIKAWCLFVLCFGTYCGFFFFLEGGVKCAVCMFKSFHFHFWSLYMIARILNILNKCILRVDAGWTDSVTMNSTVYIRKELPLSSFSLKDMLYH